MPIVNTVKHLWSDRVRLIFTLPLGGGEQVLNKSEISIHNRFIREKVFALKDL